MKVKEYTFSKSIKIGLPNYSNVDVHFGMTVEAEEGEKVDLNTCWDHVNKELYMQTDGIEPGWMKTQEYKNFFKTTVKMPKVDGGES